MASWGSATWGSAPAAARDGPPQADCAMGSGWALVRDKSVGGLPVREECYSPLPVGLDIVFGRPTGLALALDPYAPLPPRRERAPLKGPGVWAAAGAEADAPKGDAKAAASKAADGGAAAGGDAKAPAPVAPAAPEAPGAAAAAAAAADAEAKALEEEAAAKAAALPVAVAYVVDSASDRLSKFAVRAGRVLWSVGCEGSEAGDCLRSPQAVCVSAAVVTGADGKALSPAPARTVYVTDMANDRVSAYSAADGAFVGLIGADAPKPLFASDAAAAALKPAVPPVSADAKLQYPTGICYAPVRGGELFVGDCGRRRICVYDAHALPSTRLLRVYAPPQPAVPTAAAGAGAAASPAAAADAKQPAAAAAPAAGAAAFGCDHPLALCWMPALPAAGGVDDPTAGVDALYVLDGVSRRITVLNAATGAVLSSIADASTHVHEPTGMCVVDLPAPVTAAQLPGGEPVRRVVLVTDAAPAATRVVAFDARTGRAVARMGAKAGAIPATNPAAMGAFEAAEHTGAFLRGPSAIAPLPPATGAAAAGGKAVVAEVVIADLNNRVQLCRVVQDTR